MSDELEDLLRSEFAARTRQIPAPRSDLADAAIGGARRLRRRRRLAAGAGGAAAAVLAAALAWTPLSALVESEGRLPAAGGLSTEEVRSEFDLEFVAEREGRFGVVNTEDEFIEFTDLEQEPLSVKRFDRAYAVVAAEEVTLYSLDGSDSGTIVMPDGFETALRGSSDAAQFALVSFDATDSTRRTDYRIYPAEVAAMEAEPVEFTAGNELTLQDWDASTAVFSGPLHSVTASVPGTYNFEAEFDWGMQAVGRAGFETAVIVDEADPGFACVSDLEPGVGAALFEECGSVADPQVQASMAESGSGQGAVEMVTATSQRWQDEGVFAGDGRQEEFYQSERHYFDPWNRWWIAFSGEDETWKLLDLTGADHEVSELAPPPGALFPVESFT